MPAVLRREDWPAWLGETEASVADLKVLLQTYEDDGAWNLAGQQKPARPSAQAELF
jgi:putative SOS response-associated peptidase YedK